MSASTFIKIAAAHLELQQADSVLKYIHLAEDYYYHKGKVDKITEIPMYIDIVWFQYYGLTGNHEQAMKYFAKAQEFALKYNMMYDYHNHVFFEAKYYIQRGENQVAINRLLSTLDYLKKNEMIHEEPVCLQDARNCLSKNQPARKIQRIPAQIHVAGR